LKWNVAVAGPVEMAPGGEATFCEYKGLSPVVEIHAANIFTSYERWGFFRIGILPILVADHLQIQIQSAPYLANALADIKTWHQVRPASRQLEAKSLEITLRGEKEPRLRASLARVGPDATIKLSDVTFRDIEGKQVSVSKATLLIAGPSAGRLCWNSDGRQEECFLFQTPNDKKP